MHSMLDLKKFENSYQILEKKSILCFLRKKSSKTHKECLNKFIWHKIFITNTLGINVHKMYECDKYQMPYYNVKKFKKRKF
jgi:hypothetical protein